MTSVALEDRVLVLQDKVDVLTKSFDPNQPRAGDGKWSEVASGTGITRPITLTRTKGGDELGSRPEADHPDVYDVKVGDQKLKLYIRQEGDHLEVEYVGSEEQARVDLGAKAVRSLLREIKGLYPDAKTIGGERMTGARTADGADEGGRTVVNLTKLEDRVLILQDQVDVIAKTFDPNQPRDKEGQWAGTGAEGGKGKTVLDHVPNAKGWLTTTRIGQAVNHVTNNMGSLAKEALSHAVATAMTYHSRSGPDYDAVQESVVHLANRMEVSAHAAREQIVSVLQKLKTMRHDSLNKAAKKDPVIEQIDKAIKTLDDMPLDDKPPKKDKAK